MGSRQTARGLKGTIAPPMEDNDPDDARWWLLPPEALLRQVGSRGADPVAWAPVRRALGSWTRRADARDAARTEPSTDPGAAVPGASMCPSVSARPGTWLLGRVALDGTMQWAPSARRLGAEAAALETPAGRTGLRVAGPCLGSRCGYWHERQCQLIETLVALGPPPGAVATGACAVRDECRWRAQHGDAACAVCPGVTRGMWDRRA